MTTPFWAIDTVFVSDIVESVANLYFLHQSLCLIPWHLYSEATGLPSLNSRTISQITLHLPPLPEQQAIAEVLTALDDELRALDERRGKTQHLKRGMMASLLSGKVRLR